MTPTESRPPGGSATDTAAVPQATAAAETSASDAGQRRPSRGATAPRFRRQAMAARGAGTEYGAPVTTRQWFLTRTGDRAADRRPRTPVRDRLAGSRGRRVPVRLQAQTSDCGAAVLSMVFALHGLEVPMTELRRATATGRDGVTARRLLDVARSHGFQSRGVQVRLEALRELPRGSILFWNFNHFVVLERVTGDTVYLVDPAHGRRRMTLSAVGDAFTGVALLVRPGLSTPVPAGRTGARTDSPWQYLRLFLPRSPRWLPFTVSSLLLLLFNLATPLAVQNVVDRVTPGRHLHGAALLWLGLVVLAGSFFVLQFVRSMSFLAIQTVVDETVTLGILDRLFALPYEFFTSRSSGDLLQRVRTSSAVRQVLSVSAFISVFDGVLILVYMVLLLLADPLLASLVMAMAVLQVLLLVGSWRSQEYASADALESRSRAEAELFEILDGMPTLKSAGVEGPAGQRWSHSLAGELNTRFRSRRLLALTTSLSAALQTAAPLVILAAGSLRIAAGALSPGKVLAFSVLAMGLLVPLANLVQVGLQVSGLGASLSRLGDIMQSPAERRGSDAVLDVAGALELEEVSFAYQSGHTVLRDVSLKVPCGSFTTVLGASGSGKSSCALLLAGLHRPTAGRVLVDGQDLASADATSYRRTIAFVTQDARLFSGTIRENISWGGTRVSEADIEEAARLAGIHADVAALPMGYDTLLGSGGTGLSGGQRQRIVLARALVRKPRLLILDEATSALDPVLEAQIFDRLRALGCTLVVVAHRLTAVEEADQIIVLDRGEVAQTGRHEELVGVPGPYRELVGR
ncbi:peptidase domain-containing ABC transporter [Streptomyces sp. NPDC047841]|uniref:peptidase domain-containing ABC transporter n=1 Tax=Streptomyces sp. NPDC047841 TaxID=3154708 RepID=UPI00345344E4